MVLHTPALALGARRSLEMLEVQPLPSLKSSTKTLSTKELMPEHVFTQSDKGPEEQKSAFIQEKGAGLGIFLKTIISPGDKVHSRLQSHFVFICNLCVTLYRAEISNLNSKMLSIKTFAEERNAAAKCFNLYLPVLGTITVG